MLTILTQPAWTPYILFDLIVAITICFVLYELRFKYPPSIRLLRDFKRVIKFGRDPSKLSLKTVRTRQQILESAYKLLIEGKADYWQYAILTRNRKGTLELVEKLLDKIRYDPNY
jgi:hypothetical protein